MKVAVYDAYVVKKDGRTMRFDVIVPEGESHERVLGFGRGYLKGVGQEGQTLNHKGVRALPHRIGFGGDRVSHQPDIRSCRVSASERKGLKLATGTCKCPGHRKI